MASLDAVLPAIYDVISGPAGQRRDWDRFRSLFRPDARMIPVGAPQGETRPRALFVSVEDYIQRVDGLFKERGFFEREIGRATRL